MSDLPEDPESRVLVLAPTPRDAATTRDLLAAAGVSCLVCPTVAEICREAALGAGAVFVTAEAVVGDAGGLLAGLVRSQPPWSDLPMIVLTPAGEDSPRMLKALEDVGPMTLMKRPVQMAPLVSTIRSALRDRKRQYEVRELLAERERAAELLAAERERYRVTLSSIGDAVIATDTEGRVTFLNPVAEELMRWSPDDVLGRPLEEVFRIVDESTRLPVPNPAVKALGEGVAVGLDNHTILIARDGTERPLDDSAAPIRGPDGTTVGAVLVFRDISERKRAEAVLRVSEERYRVLVTATSDVVYLMSPDWAEMQPLDGRELVASNTEPIRDWMQKHVPGFEHARLRAAIDAAVAGVRTFEMEHQVFRRDGSLGWTFSRAAPVLNAEGDIVEWFGTARDITDRKRMEDELRDADRRKDDFIALLAHELRNPLAPIRNGLQVIRLSEDPATRERSRRMMDRQLSHMVRMIDDLLDVSRIGRNKMELRRAKVTLADIVSSAVETAGPAIQDAGHELTVSLPPRPVLLDADLTRLSQVFSNLLTNSARYTERGGRIWLSAARVGGGVVVSVRDTGIGIPAKALTTIFDMFSQVDRSFERSTGGLGIGLALVKGLVEMHGGTVTARSEGPGRGSEFTVTLPALAEQSPDAAATPDIGRSETPPKRKVLVVDDNLDGAESLAMMLELVGNEVVLARDGIQAVEQAERFRPEAILMDVGMPRLDGLEATRRIRQRPWGRDMTIIALTGWGQDADRERSREAGCDGHLVKPVSFQDLEKLLEELRPRRTN